MNAITVSETVVEVVAAETEDNTPGITYLSSDAKEIPLSRLVPSPANVRRFNAAVNVGELADSIEAHGLIQNLTVRKAKRGNKYEVVAGSAASPLSPFWSRKADWTRARSFPATFVPVTTATPRFPLPRTRSARPCTSWTRFWPIASLSRTA
ncbi:ParB N-terminal domain-containing protein [Rhizobium sp. X9]|jgi:hypothetical protein|uniref:ParB/RepB/Spo0J family partition protein n=1 Tax=Rhizobium sp. X9 TaxID=2815360 RepID=UPI00209B682C|nr:ParB N-terminal domain-containing protein [Rhizobium sp. X9]